MVTWILLIVGGINWLLVALVDWEIGDLFGGSSSGISRLIYLVVGLSAIYEIVSHKKTCKMCDVKATTPSQPQM